MAPQRRTIFTRGIILKRSAKKQSFTEADVLYEMRNAMTVKEDFEASRVPKTWRSEPVLLGLPCPGWPLRSWGTRGQITHS